MTKIKFDGWKYYAFCDINGWLSFWDTSQGAAAIAMKAKFGDLIPNKEYEIKEDIVHFTNCGGPKTCSALWPNPDCGHCGGKGVGAEMSEITNT